LILPSLSWFLRVIRKPSETPTAHTYEVDAFRNSGANSFGPLEFKLDRDSILSDFKKLIPSIWTSSIRLGSVYEQIQYEPLELVIALGQKIYFALNPEVREVINASYSIHLYTSDIEIPWEIMHDGLDFVSITRSFGIGLASRKRISERETQMIGRLSILMIVDPENNLPKAQEETNKIISLLNDNIKVDTTILQGKEATYSAVRSRLAKESFDILHVAAHTQFNPTKPKESIIFLNDGCLSAGEIYRDIQNYSNNPSEPPWLVFMNSCESAKILDLTYFEKYGELLGLAAAFITSGALSYIGTSGIINDSYASEIAVNFYKYLLRGSTTGESLRKAKYDFRKNHLKDASWSVFKLYGNPNTDLRFSQSGRDLLAEIKGYLKQKEGSFNVQDCAADLDITISEVNDIIYRLKSG
jgi:hypothetical protein